MYIKKKKNKSGTTSIQVIEKVKKENKVLKIIGTAVGDDELEKLEQQAEEYIRYEKRRRESQQLKFNFCEETQEGEIIRTFLETNNCKVNLCGPELILGKIFDEIGLNIIPNELFKDIVITRLIYPVSKLKTTEYLAVHKNKSISASGIYKFLDKFYKEYQNDIQQIIYQHSKKIIGEISIVFYDMTTLYYEAEDEDDLRKIGFSKDGKFQCPQIMLGLLVTEYGYPITYNIFEGNTWEGITLLKVIKESEEKYHIKKPIVIADSGLLSKTNLKLLEEEGYEYILGARIKNENEAIKKEILEKAIGKQDQQSFEIEKNQNGKSLRMIISYSEKRALKDEFNRKKGLKRLNNKFSKGRITKKDICNRGYNKFLTLEGQDGIKVNISQEKIKEDACWDGLKGYVTNSKLKRDEVLKNYSHLWQIEKAFRISKTDLRIRPIFHRKRERIEAHICIVFTAYAVFKELERKIKKATIPISPQKALEAIKTIYKVEFYIPELARNVSIWSNLTPIQKKLLDL